MVPSSYAPVGGSISSFAPAGTPSSAGGLPAPPVGGVPQQQGYSGQSVSSQGGEMATSYPPSALPTGEIATSYPHPIMSSGEIPPSNYPNPIMSSSTAPQRIDYSAIPGLIPLVLPPGLAMPQGGVALPPGGAVAFPNQQPRYINLADYAASFPDGGYHGVVQQPQMGPPGTGMAPLMHPLQGLLPHQDIQPVHASVSETVEAVGSVGDIVNAAPSAVPPMAVPLADAP